MSNKLVVFKKPGPLVKKERESNTLDRIWPKIVDHVSANPQLTDDDLFVMYGSSCNEPDKARFIQRCKLRGLKQLRGTLKETRDRNASAEITKKRILSIEERRKKGGVKFITRMDRLVRKATTALADESEQVAIGKAHLGDHINNMKNLVKVGKDVYNIDADGGHDAAKMNIAILMGFDPMANQQDDDVIEMES
jgi:hypothetical protein